MSLLCKLVPERCIACGLCQIEAPDIFDYDEEGIVLFAQVLVAKKRFVMPEEETYVKKAYQKCPVRAILLENKIYTWHRYLYKYNSILLLKISRDLFLLFREIPTYFERFICYL
ncbi:hypothetical protein EfmAA818_11610 [Enterococcus faecium]|nr:hypothetical protein EfmAA818_11610 [Enterococcus faecium]